MNKKAAYILEELTWILVTVVVSVVATLFFGKLFASSPDDFFKNISAPFWGAFFAFMFVVIASFVKRMYDRKLRHYNALVKMEIRLNDNFSTIDHNRVALDIYIKNLKLAAGNQCILSPNSLYDFLILEEQLMDLGSKSIINELFKYNAFLTKINIDFMTYRKAYENALDLAFKRNDMSIYAASSIQLIEHCVAMLKFLDLINSKTFALLVKTRAYLESKPILNRLSQFLHLNEPANLEKRIKKQEKMLREEMNESIKNDTQALSEVGIQARKNNVAL